MTVKKRSTPTKRRAPIVRPSRKAAKPTPVSPAPTFVYDAAADRALVCCCGNWRYLPSPEFEVTSITPLTVVGDVVCPLCGQHGEIAAGEWIAA